VKTLILIVITIILYSGCANKEPYAWNKDVPFQTILAQSGGKLVLMDFETEW
jgi:PBP1b-binding outer membrane lipoprotein LpoB